MQKSYESRMPQNRHFSKTIARMKPIESCYLAKLAEVLVQPPLGVVLHLARIVLDDEALAKLYGFLVRRVEVHLNPRSM